MRNKRAKAALARVVNATFDESQHYYQGFHDVAAVVLDVAMVSIRLVSGEPSLSAGRRARRRP